MSHQNTASPPGQDHGGGAFLTHLDYRLAPAGGKPSTMLAFGILEWTFIVALIMLVGAAGLFGAFLVLQQFRNPTRRP